MNAIHAVRLIGYHARLDNRPRTSNPYTNQKARPFRDAWFAGYDKATAMIRGTSRKGKS